MSIIIWKSIYLKCMIVANGSIAIPSWTYYWFIDVQLFANMHVFAFDSIVNLIIIWITHFGKILKLKKRTHRHKLNEIRKKHRMGWTQKHFFGNGNGCGDIFLAFQWFLFGLVPCSFCLFAQNRQQKQWTSLHLRCILLYLPFAMNIFVYVYVQCIYIWSERLFVYVCVRACVCVCSLCECIISEN